MPNTSTPTQKPGKAAAKKRYQAPALTEYGDLRKITNAKGGTLGDGMGVAPTKK